VCPTPRAARVGPALETPTHTGQGFSVEHPGTGLCEPTNLPSAGGRPSPVDGSRRGANSWLRFKPPTAGEKHVICFVEKVGFEPRTLGIPSPAHCPLSHGPGHGGEHNKKAGRQAQRLLRIQDGPPRVASRPSSTRFFHSAGVAAAPRPPAPYPGGHGRRVGGGRGRGRGRRGGGGGGGGAPPQPPPSRRSWPLRTACEMLATPAATAEKDAGAAALRRDGSEAHSAPTGPTRRPPCDDAG
jgi:hypothetical protein